MSRAKLIMVQGTMSGVGKSLLCTALCRILRQDGYRVAPFKSQNMALNSGVTRDGREIGRAQIAQAEAAGVEPDARMNPVLLKPCSDTGSQVIVNGLARAQMDAAAYMPYKRELVPEILSAYDSLAEEYDVIVVEGAGSPAEIKLRENDIVNMGLAELIDAPVLLAGDIDRGGVFAQLYGTVQLLEPAERARIRGLVINKFRGDVSLLRPGLTQIEAMTGISVLGVIPYLHIDLDDEDSLATRLSASKNDKSIDVAVIRLPHISNFTDFAPLELNQYLGIRYVNSTRDFGKPDCVILPGTKSTTGDLLWLRRNGLEAAILRLAGNGTPVLGVCGGYQMLGEELHDPDGVEGAEPMLRGMELLPCRTVFAADKTLTRVTGTIAAPHLSGARVEGYEIHSGVTEARGEAFCRLADGSEDGCCAGNVMGTYLHGLFDSGEASDRLCAWLCARKGVAAEQAVAEPRRAYRERQYDLLAEGVRAALDMDAVYRIIRGEA